MGSLLYILYQLVQTCRAASIESASNILRIAVDISRGIAETMSVEKLTFWNTFEIAIFFVLVVFTSALLSSNWYRAALVHHIYTPCNGFLLDNHYYVPSTNQKQGKCDIEMYHFYWLIGMGISTYLR